jgi:hypothetical protein
VSHSEPLSGLTFQATAKKQIFGTQFRFLFITIPKPRALRLALLDDRLHMKKRTKKGDFSIPISNSWPLPATQDFKFNSLSDFVPSFFLGTDTMPGSASTNMDCIHR